MGPGLSEWGSLTSVLANASRSLRLEALFENGVGLPRSSRNQKVSMLMRSTSAALITAFVAAALWPSAALANNVGENVGWQFDTTADKTNKAFLEDLRQKKQSGYYAAPVYNTYIDKQYNCSVSSLAAGSQGTTTAIGNSPSTTGHSASSLGNTDTTGFTPGNGTQTGSVTGTQTNTGQVGSKASGEVESSVSGNTYQTLNTEQQNTGTQTATVSASNACQFGPLN